MFAGSLLYGSRLLHGSRLQTLLVWVLGACVAAVVWYAVFYRAAHDEWVAASNELGAAHSDLEQTRRAKLRADAHAVQLDVIAADQAHTRASIIDEVGAAEDLLFTVPALASRLGLQIDLWRPLPEEVAGGLLRAPVRVDARANWPAFSEFLARLVTTPQVLALADLSLRAAPDGALELHFTISSMRLRGDP